MAGFSEVSEATYQNLENDDKMEVIRFEREFD